MIGWNDWRGHWQVIIGYDTMGTETTQDDVIVVADPYDTTDHNQDGYGVYGVERFLYSFMCRVSIPNKEIAFVYAREVISKLRFALGESTAAVIRQAIFEKNADAPQQSISAYLTETIGVYNGMIDEAYLHPSRLGHNPHGSGCLPFYPLPQSPVFCAAAGDAR